MPNYDEEQLGVNNPSHPANEIEVFDEEIQSPQEIWIENKLEEIKNIKKLWENMERKYKEGFMFISSADQNTDSVLEYVTLKGTLTHRLNKL